MTSKPATANSTSGSLQIATNNKIKSARRMYKLVLTGGPCGGKTTSQSRLSTFFENLGWKVFRVPETASVLLGGGIKFAELTEDEGNRFQENLLKTMIQMENTFFCLAETCPKDCLIICDRGAMDASAFVLEAAWEKIIKKNNWNVFELRDNRYNQVIHMVSAAVGAEEFYTTEDHHSRSEGVCLAQQLDRRAASAWVGHPYFDVIDNSTDFEIKVRRMIASVCHKLGIDTGDRLLENSKKRKYLIQGPLPKDEDFPPFEDFEVVHNYLQTTTPDLQARLRKRGQKGQWMYIHTLRKPKIKDQIIEVRTQLTHRDYLNMLTQRDESHFTIYKKRRCFLIHNQYFQLDIYQEPVHPRCRGLVFLETYSVLADEELKKRLPEFLNVVEEVTGNPKYSMFNLSLKEDWESGQNSNTQVFGSKVTSYDASTGSNT